MYRAQYCYFIIGNLNCRYLNVSIPLFDLTLRDLMKIEESQKQVYLFITRAPAKLG